MNKISSKEEKKKKKKKFSGKNIRGSKAYFFSYSSESPEDDIYIYIYILIAYITTLNACRVHLKKTLHKTLGMWLQSFHEGYIEWVKTHKVCKENA